MFLASNVAEWLPSVLTFIHSANWIIASLTPKIIVYSLASSLNVLMLKKWVYEDEINSDAKKYRKKHRDSRKEVRELEKKIVSKDKSIESKNKTIETQKDKEYESERTIFTLKAEIEEHKKEIFRITEDNEALDQMSYFHSAKIKDMYKDISRLSGRRGNNEAQYNTGEPKEDGEGYMKKN